MELQKIEFYRAAYAPGDFPRDGRPQFAIVGRSNVGKSSLINTILGRKGIARVSQTPGKTQAIHFIRINEKFYVVDLPGYGFAKVPKEMAASWGALAQSYFDSAETLRTIFLLIDARRTPGHEDLQMRDWMAAAGANWKVIMTKSDKLSGNALAKAKQTISEALGVTRDDLIEFSSVKKRGVREIWREIEQGLAR